MSEPRFPQGSGYSRRAPICPSCKRLDSQGKVNRVRQSQIAQEKVSMKTAARVCSPEDVGGFRITNVHRDYHKGEGDKVPTAAISILDSVANPDYVSATTAAWNSNSESSEGYGKSVTIDGNPGFETFEKESKHATLWVMIANRYFVQVELQNQDPKELQEWVKHVDLKKLAAIK